MVVDSYSNFGNSAQKTKSDMSTGELDARKFGEQEQIPTPKEVLATDLCSDRNKLNIRF